MLRLELRSTSSTIDLISNGGGANVLFTCFGAPAEVGFIQELIRDRFGALTVNPAELMEFLRKDEWVQSMYDGPVITDGSIDIEASTQNKTFSELTLGNKLVVAGLITDSELETLLEEYAPFSQSQRFGEFLKLKMRIPHKAIDFLLSLSKDDEQQFNAKRLGERLVDLGIVDQSSLSRALKIQASADEPQRLGEILVGMNLITPELADFFSRVERSDNQLSIKDVPQPR